MTVHGDDPGLPGPKGIPGPGHKSSIKTERVEIHYTEEGVFIYSPKINLKIRELEDTQIEEVRGMQKVDELIEKLAEHIKKLVTKGFENEIAEETKALAELISARAFVKVNETELGPIVTAE